MGTKYSSVSISGYNATPPADDGSTAASNQVTWAKHKTKLGDPIKTAVEAINTALVTALDTSARSITSNDSTVAGDNGRTIVIASTVTAAITVTLMDAATAAAGYIVNIVNDSSVACTIARATASDTISSVTSDYSLPGLTSISFVVSPSASGYTAIKGGSSSVLLVGDQTVAGNKTFTGQSSFPDGSAAAPSVRVGDEQNGLYSPSASVFGVAVNGSHVAQYTASSHTFSTSVAGTTVVNSVENLDNTNTASHAQLRAVVGGTSGGDPYTLYSITGVTSWEAGVDNSDSDSYKISNNAAGTLGTNDYLRIDASGNLGFNSGYGSAATAYGCRAWVNFNGTGTVAIRASGNVTSITDNGTGNYTVNLTNAMPDANYAPVFGAQYSTTTIAGLTSQISTDTNTTTACQIHTAHSGTNAAVDLPGVYVAFFR